MAFDGPTGRQRVGFWLLLGLTSTAFAEVLFPTTAFDPMTMAIFAVPIYLLHSVVLAAVVYQSNRVSYPTLYLAGVLLGLYEAYVTKTLWAPLGDRPTLSVGGVYVFETLGLVLFWHPVVAFLLPVVVVETVATASERSLGPPLAGHRFSRPLVVSIVVYLLLFQGALGGPFRALVGNAVALTVLLVALFAWRRNGGHTHDMRSLLPSGRSLRVLAGVLVTVSVGLGLLIRPDELPVRPTPHLLVLSMYVVAGSLLAALLRSEGSPSGDVNESAASDPAVGGRVRPGEESPSVDVVVIWRRLLAVASAIVLASPLLGYLGAALLLPVFLSYYVVAVLIGTSSLIWVVLALR